MAQKKTALADLDITSEALAQQDGLAERIARARGATLTDARETNTMKPTETPTQTVGPSSRNAWRRGKSVLQVAVPDDIYVELSIIAKRRRISLSAMTKDALNDWLTRHGHTLVIPE